MTNQFWARGAAVPVWLFLIAGSLFGQAVDANLVGTVIDATGAVLPKTQITATNEETGVAISAFTDGAGQYRINHLPAGSYDVKAEAGNFATQTLTGVRLQLNHTATANFGLQLASQLESVGVVAAPPPIDASTSQLQVTFDARSLIELSSAASGTGFLNLSLLGAGVASSGGLGLGMGPSVGGQRPSNNRFYVEGVDNSSYFSPGPLGYVSNEALAQFTVLQNQFSGEFGGASGGIFNAVVKSGGNQIHGSAYEYLQNRNLNALDASVARQLQAANQPLTPARFDSNRMGATIGGPIQKNKLFYFGDFEYNPIGYAFTPGPVVSAPTAAGYQTLGALAGISKTNLQVFQQYVPAAAAQTSSVQVLGSSIPVGSLSIVAPSYSNSYRALGSADWNVSDRDQLRGRYIYGRFSGIDTSNVTLPVFFITLPSNTHLISLSEFHTFSPALQNELRVAYSRNFNRRAASDLTFPGVDSFPTIYIADLNGLQLGPNPNIPNGQVQGEFQAADNLTRVWGRHTLKAGYDFHDIILTSSFVSYPRGYYGYNTLSQYLQDLSPDGFATRTLGTTGPLVNGMPAGFLQNAVYVNDDFRVRQNLTLNLGVRYEYVTVPVLSRAQQYSAIADVPGVITFREPQPTKKDWSPRIGFAYSPGTQGIWSIRGGFGRAFDMPYANIALNTIPAFYGGTVGADGTPNFLANGGLTRPSSVLSTVAGARAAISGFTPDQQRPYAINYTLAVERLLGKDYTIEARYLGSKGVHLFVQGQLNRTTAVTAARNIPTFLSKPTPEQLAPLTLTTGDIRAVSSNAWAQYGFTNSNSVTAYEPRGNSQYRGLAVQLSKRYSKSFSYLAAYTWSHLMDDSTATVNSTLLTPRRPQDFNNLRSEWATSMLDRRHRFTLTPIYDFTPFKSRNWALKNVVGNWNVSFTYTYESPEYATPQSGVDSNFNNDSQTDRTIINPSGAATVGSGVTGYDRNGNAVAASSNAIVAYVANNPDARYIVAGIGAYANGGRNTFPLDPINNIDFSLRKRFSIGEQKQVELGAQFYNLLNHPQFVPGYVNDVAPLKNANRNFLLPSNAGFGQYQQLFSSNSRFIQIVARISF